MTVRPLHHHSTRGAWGVVVSSLLAALGSLPSPAVAGGTCPFSTFDGTYACLTHNANKSDEGTQAACQAGDGTTTPNAFARCFDLLAEGIEVPVRIHSVKWGVDQFDSSSGDIQPVWINIYIDTVCPPSMATAVLEFSTEVMIGTADAGRVFTTLLSVPLFIDPSQGQFLVVEIEAPVDGTLGTPGDNYSFRPMAHSKPACSDALLRADDCGAPDWVGVTDIGFPNSQTLIEVNGAVVGSPGVICGNGIVQACEECDDDNTMPGDGCDENCQVESFFLKGHQKISDTAGNFMGGLGNSDNFGVAVAALGDLDGDGVADLAVGAHLDDDGAVNRGAVWILFLNADGTVKTHQKISSTEGGFDGPHGAGRFGTSLAAIGDLDGDGVQDLAAGAYWDGDGGSRRGAVWILFLNGPGPPGPNGPGTVKSHQKISDTAGEFNGILDNHDRFGHSVAGLGDVNGDGVVDLAVGATFDDDGGLDLGAVWILFLNTDGTVKGHQKISDDQGGFGGNLSESDHFGIAAYGLGDVDGDGVPDLAVGCAHDDDGGPDRGAVWVLLLNDTGTVKDHRKISSTAGGFTGVLDDGDNFGLGVLSPGDLDGDGVDDLVVGARRDDDGGVDHGAVWVLFLNANGTVREHQKFSDTQGGFTGELDVSDWFGVSLAALGDLDGDGVVELAVGAYRDDDGDTDRGAVWVLFLGGAPPPAKCPADFDKSGDVGVKDLLFLLGAWGPCPPKGDCPADFDDSGNVGVKDLLFLLGAWGPCP